MDQFKDKKAVSSLLREAILQLCRVSVGMQGNFTIDGIICIGSIDREDQEFIVKIHETAVSSVFSNPGQSGNTDIQTILPDNATSTGISVSPLVNMAQADLVPQISLSKINLPNNSKQQTNHFVAVDKQMQLAVENDIEILNIPSVSSQKQLFGDIDNFSDIECTGCEFDDISFSDVVIKPDPGMFTKMSRNSLSADLKASNSGDESSDEELKIETLKAGRVRKANKGAYTDIDGAPVQVLSAEEFKRILKSEKLKRSRDKSPDFVNPAKSLRATADGSVFYRRQFPTTHKVAAKTLDKEAIESQAWNTTVAQTTPPSNIVKYKVPQHYGKQLQRHLPMNSVFTTVSNIQNEVNVTVTKSNSPQVEYHMDNQVENDNLSNDGKLETLSVLSIQNQAMAALNKFPEISVSSVSTTSGCDETAGKPVYTLSNPKSLLKKKFISNIVPPPQASTQATVRDSNVICLDGVNKATQSKVHECPVCASVFDTFRLLDLHMYRLHPGMFLCPVCAKSFKQRSTRNRHIVALHSTEKNFVCHMCNASFTRTDTLKKHYGIHHPDVAFPKKSYSYAKGKSILSSELITEASEIPNIPEQATTNQQGETKHISYTDTCNFITPIQVTAAVDNTDSGISGVIPKSANITNITPYLPESVVAEAEENCDSSENVKPNVSHKMEQENTEQSLCMELGQDGNQCNDNGMVESQESYPSGASSSSVIASEENSDNTKLSLHSVTHMKPIDLTRQLSGVQQTLQKMPQVLNTAMSAHCIQTTGLGEKDQTVFDVVSSSICGTDIKQIVSTFTNQPDSSVCDDSTISQTNVIVHSSPSEQSALPTKSSSLGTDNMTNSEGEDVSHLSPAQKSGSVTSDIMDSQHYDHKLQAKCETEENGTGYMDTIEISDEDNSVPM